MQLSKYTLCSVRLCVWHVWLVGISLARLGCLYYGPGHGAGQATGNWVQLRVCSGNAATLLADFPGFMAASRLAHRSRNRPTSAHLRMETCISLVRLLLTTAQPKTCGRQDAIRNDQQQYASRVMSHEHQPLSLAWTALPLLHDPE